MTDIQKLKTWFEDYLVSEQPQQIGGGTQEVYSNDEDISGLLFLKGRADQSVADEILSQLCLTKTDLNRYALAFKKLEELSTPHTYRNALRLRMSAPYQRQISTLLELEDHAHSVRSYDPHHGSNVPHTDLSQYKL